MKTSMVLQNPQATMPLIYGLDVVCNTPDEEILANVLENSRKVAVWAKSLPAHDRVLAICGSGPSLDDEFGKVSELRRSGAEVWALNNCANYLASRGIVADEQVIMDARLETAELIGPARGYLFASQVHPECFARCSTAKLWHATVGNILPDQQPGFPDHDDEYCLIGSAVTVGNTALVLAFALGYRTVHLFGYDSSHRQSSGHVLHQRINDGDPLTVTKFRGRGYVSSFTMKLQADAFPSRASTLVREGLQLFVHGSGLLPDRWNASYTELEKYTAMWDLEDYREVAPGELLVSKFLSIAQPFPHTRIIDFGCGTGRAAVALAAALPCDLTLVDLTTNSRDPAAQRFPFLQADLTSSWPLKVEGDYGYCTDVLEHLPTDVVDKALVNIMCAVPKCFFQISTVEDSFGSYLGHPLHLTVAPAEWWFDTFTSLGYRITWSEVQASAVLLYVERENDAKAR